jgi:hypothetical protein
MAAIGGGSGRRRIHLGGIDTEPLDRLSDHVRADRACGRQTRQRADRDALGVNFKVATKPNAEFATAEAIRAEHK